MNGSKRIKINRIMALQFGTSLLGAAVFLLVFDEWINDFIAMPLRVLSTAISKFVVSVCGYDVIREGTSLVVGTFRFNVDLACSGSKTLQQMIAAAILLAGIWGGLSLVQKSLAVLVAIPIALLTNGLRVSGLMLASLYLGHGLPEETFEHQFIGILAFALALLLFWQVCKNVGSIRLPVWVEGVTRLVIYLLLLLIIFFPFLYNTGVSWSGSAWNPYNRYAEIFALIALGLFLLRHCRGGDDSMQVRLTRTDIVLGLFLTMLGACWAIVVIRLGFVTVQGAGLVAVLAGCLVLALGLRRFLWEIPVILIMLLSFPRLPLFLSDLLGGYSGYDWGVLFGVRIAISVLLGLVYLRGTGYLGRSTGSKTGVQTEVGGRGIKPILASGGSDRRWLGVYLILLLAAGEACSGKGMCSR